MVFLLLILRVIPGLGNIVSVHNIHYNPFPSILLSSGLSF